MTTTADAQKKRATTKRTRPAQKKQAARDGEQASGGLTGKQVFALWALLLTGDGKPLSKQKVRLDKAAVKGLESARLISIEPGRQRKNDPSFGATLHVTEEGWAWANGQGLAAAFARTSSAAKLLEVLLAKLGKYMEVHGLALAHLLQPRPAETGATEDALTRHETPGAPAQHDAEPAAIEERIRAAYLRLTGGAFNQYIRLALLRAQLRDEPVEALETGLRDMQRKGGAVLYPIDDPQRLRAEDDAVAIRIAGERRDLICITR